jgi:hypothetical protein
LWFYVVFGCTASNGFLNLEGPDGADGNRLIASGDQFFCCGLKLFSWSAQEPDLNIHRGNQPVGAVVRQARWACGFCSKKFGYFRARRRDCGSIEERCDRHRERREKEISGNPAWPDCCRGSGWTSRWLLSSLRVPWFPVWSSYV